MPPAGKPRGAARWVAREETLVPQRPKWPDKANAFQIATPAGMGWLVMACAALPLTFGKHAHLLSHTLLLFTATAAIACLGLGIILRAGPTLIQGVLTVTSPRPRRNHAAPGPGRGRRHAPSAGNWVVTRNLPGLIHPACHAHKGTLLRSLLRSAGQARAMGFGADSGYRQQAGGGHRPGTE
jgi:hypothetical protein